MTKFLLTTAIVTVMAAGALKAEEVANPTFFQSMTQTIQNWWTGGNQKTEVEAYLDEVAVTVPPMTGGEAANIEPAAGDYMPSLQEIMTKDGQGVQGNAPLNAAPGSQLIDQEAEDDQAFNTDFTNQAGSVAAFGEAETMAEIQPAAGEAAQSETIPDEAIVTAAEDMTEDTMTEAETMTQDAMDDMTEAAADMAETATEAQQEMTETMTDMMAKEGTMTEPTMTEPAAGQAKDAMDGMSAEQPMMNDAQDTIESMETMDAPAAQ